MSYKKHNPAVAIRILPDKKWDLVRLSGKYARMDAESSSKCLVIPMTVTQACNIPSKSDDFVRFMQSKIHKAAKIAKHIPEIEEFLASQGIDVPDFGQKRYMRTHLRSNKNASMVTIILKKGTGPSTDYGGDEATDHRITKPILRQIDPKYIGIDQNDEAAQWLREHMVV